MDRYGLTDWHVGINSALGVEADEYWINSITHIGDQDIVEPEYGSGCVLLGVAGLGNLNRII